MKNIDYEVIDIKPTDSNFSASEWTFVKSEWTVVIDGINKVATECNSITGESRPYDYDQAMRELFG